MAKEKYKFSVIIPIYNVEEYIGETLDSLINQTIGFEENIQVILVNDGSPDNSEKVCLEYREQYPNNIKYIKKENGGVSSARNEGIKHIEGKYVNFLDSDDLWEENAFEEAYKFLEENKDVDVVSAKIRFFGARTGENHPLNFKYEENKVVDLNDEYNFIQLSSVTAFIRKEAIKEGFPTELKYAEDALFINKILLEKRKYGVIGTTAYLYRKREDGSSALDNSLNNKNYYLNVIEYFHKGLINYCNDKFGEIPKFIQFTMMYDLQWKIKSKLKEGILTKEELQQFKKDLTYVLNNIDDQIIFEQRQLNREDKEEAYIHKYGKITDSLELKKNKIYFNDLALYSLRKRLVISILEMENNTLTITGYFNIPLTQEKTELSYYIDGKKYKVDFAKNDYSNIYSIDKKIQRIKFFSLKLDVRKAKEIYFTFTLNGEESEKLAIQFNYLAKLNNEYRLFYNCKNKIISYSKKTIKLENKTTSKLLKKEIKLELQLLKHFKIKSIFYRLTYYILKFFKKKEIWLVSDRPDVANDNGYHMFKYIVNKKDQDIKPYFVLRKDSQDYDKLNAIGTVVKYDSFKYKMLFLLSDVIISSQADLWVQNAFGIGNKYVRDLYKYKFVFLQHGIIQNDLSTWLKYYDKNLKIFVTSAQREYDSIVNGNYGYKDNQIKLTGLPRYDNLKNNNKKMIAIMPTWRKYLADDFINKKGARGYNDTFKESNYYKHYNQLINDPEILECMKKHGYKGLFVVHPSHVKNAKDFKGNEIFKVNSGYADYQKIFGEASLMVTDYSSVHFDFAYLNKPAVYTQFDKVEFFGGHTYSEGYFNYEKDCFGPVVYNYEDTKKEIIRYIESDCKLEKKYQNRINKFYKYHDKKNCERVYKEIKKLQGK